MKPAPFEDINYKDTQTKLTVISDVETRSTVVKNKNGSDLWRWNEFIGRRAIVLSPKGDTMILIGGFYFGGQVKSDKDGEVAVVVKKGQTSKKMTLANLFSTSIEEILRKYDLREYGGGWCNFEELIPSYQVDWQNKQIIFKLVTGEYKKLAF